MYIFENGRNININQKVEGTLNKLVSKNAIILAYRHSMYKFILLYSEIHKSFDCIYTIDLQIIKKKFIEDQLHNLVNQKPYLFSKLSTRL